MELVRKCAGAVCLLGIMTGLLFLGQQEGKLTADKEMQQAVTPEAKEAAGEGKSAEEEVRKIAITFDDGPHPKYTAELLDGLKERGVVVTFFMTGENAEANRELVKRAYEEGHLIGNHTYSHIHYVALGYEVLEFAYELDFSDLFNTLTYCLECLCITNVLVLRFLFCCHFSISPLLFGFIAV